MRNKGRHPFIQTNMATAKCRLLAAKVRRGGVLRWCKLRFCSAKEEWPVIPKDEVQRFIEDCMIKVGTRSAHAQSLGGNLVEADYRGHYSHGLNRLG